MIRKRIRAYTVGDKSDVKGWRSCLTGTPAFLIGNGPSLTKLDLSVLKNHFTIGINRAFFKIDPTILLWQDSELWWQHRTEINRLKAIKYCRDMNDPKCRFYHYKLGMGGFRLPDSPAVLYGRGASGPLAFQLAWSLGCDPIILLGFDCCYRDGMTDFYGKNPSHKPHTLTNCRRGLEWIKNCGSGRTIINCSDNNTFKESHSLDDVMRTMPDPERPANRDSLISRLKIDPKR